MEIFDLKGKTAVVTGAARGIGKATADLLEKAGAKVFRIDLDAGIRCDVADEKQVEKAFQETGPVDILVNNAGIAVRKNAFDISAEEWDRVIGVNLRRPVPLLARGGARHEGKGRRARSSTSPRSWASRAASSRTRPTRPRRAPWST